MAKVLVTDPLDPSAVQALRAAGHEVDERKVTPEELLKLIGGYDALLVRSETKVTKVVLGMSDRLKVVGRAGVGVDNIDTVAAKERGVAVVNAPLAATNAVAELTLGHMLSLSRSLTRADVGTREGKWEKKALMGVELSGRTLGLLGSGRIGSRVAELARAFGMSVLVFDPFVDAAKAREIGATKVNSPEELVSQSDFVSIHTPLTSETKHIVNAKLLSHFKPTAFIVNCARGGIIDEAALYDAIVAQKLAGAALDVFEVEPMKESPLTKLPNVHFTPHVGASTHEAQAKAGRMVAEQVQKVLAGEKPDFRVV